MVTQGDTFYGGADIHGDDHLWIVINSPPEHGGRALIVNVSTFRPGAETTCLIEKGEHPFVTHQSYVRYRSARETNMANLVRAVDLGKLRRHAVVSAALLTRIRSGAAASRLLPSDLRRLL